MAMAVPVPATGTALLCPDEPTAGQIVDDGSVESARPNLVTPQETSCSVSKSAIERDRNPMSRCNIYEAHSGRENAFVNFADSQQTFLVGVAIPQMARHKTAQAHNA
jgi:hypothetical protein